MRSVIAPSDAFLHSSPISWRTRYHDDPSGASVAILMTVGAANAARGTDPTAASSRIAAASLIEKKFIHPPFQPARPALGYEVVHPVLRRRRPRVEGERAVEEIQEPFPILGPDRHRFGEGDQRRNLPPPGQCHRPFHMTTCPFDGSPHRLGTPPFEGNEKLVDRSVVVPVVERERPAHQG